MRTGLITFIPHSLQGTAPGTCHHAGHPVPGARLRDHRLPPAPHHPHQPAFQKERRRARHGLRRPHRPPLRGVPAPLPALRGLCGRGDGPLPPAVHRLRATQADPPAYDVYVAGSDQIWNPYIFQDKQFDPSFLLGFVREGRRIAYAPSLGVPELPEDKAEELRRFLTPFSALSVREKRGQVLLREAAGREAWVVLDPTLLLTGEDQGRAGCGPQTAGALYPVLLCLRPRRGGPLRYGPVGAHRLAHRAARGGPAEDRRGGRAGL